MTTQLRMRRDLRDLPPVDVPSGYELRTWRDGDDASWAALMDGVLGAWTSAQVAEGFLAQEGVKPERVYLLLRGGELVASATAQLLNGYAPDTGWLHMVAVAPHARGARLGYWVSLAVLHHLRDHGCATVLLSTDDERTPAIRTYLRLGFRPQLVADDHAQRWTRLGISL